jgi:hypothetical protein
LAHEFGHVLWYDTYVPVRGGPAHFNNFCSDGTSDFYTGPLGSWADVVGEPPSPIGPGPSRWRFVGDVAGHHKPGDVDIRDLLGSIPPPGGPDNRGAGQKLRRLYAPPGGGVGTGRWAGLFAAFSPQEDFVETFKLFVLRKAAAPLQSLPISIPIGGGPPVRENVPASCPSRPALQRKLSCFQAALCGDPAADPCGFTCAPKP